MRLDPKGLQQSNSNGDQRIDIEAVAERARDVIICSYKVIKIPDYFMDAWLPLLGASRWFLTLAFRQVAFIHNCKERTGQQFVSATTRRLGQWAGLSHTQVKRLLKKPQFLDWFVTRKEAGNNTTAGFYGVRIDIPLTPADQYRIRRFFEAEAPTTDEEWYSALSRAISVKGSDLPNDYVAPKGPRTIQQLAMEMGLSDLTESLDRACDELHERWTRPTFSQVTHYWIKNWLPELTPSLGAFILYCRKNCREDGQVGQLKDIDYGVVGRELGVTSRSIRYYISKEKYPLVQSFIDVSRSHHICGQLDDVGEDRIRIKGCGIGFSKDATITVLGFSRGDRVRVLADETPAGDLQLREIEPASSNDTEGALIQIDLDVALTDPIHKSDRARYEAVLKAMAGDYQTEIHQASSQALKKGSTAMKNSSRQMKEGSATEKISAAEEKISSTSVQESSTFEKSGSTPQQMRSTSVQEGAALRGIKDNENNLRGDSNILDNSGSNQDDLESFKINGQSILSVWDSALGQMRGEINRSIFDTWIASCELHSFDPGSRTFVVATGNSYARDWLADRMTSTVRRVLTGITGESANVQFVSWGDASEQIS